MKILLTGASGFLGKILKEELTPFHEIITLGRKPENDISNDLRKEIPEVPEVDMIIHAAGKAHVIPKTEQEKKEFFKVNEKGTENLLKSIEKINPKIFILISTVAVYGKEKGENIDEEEPLFGDTPYALSKIKAEKLVMEYGERNSIKTLILRLPLIIGPNAPGNLGAISKAIQKGYYFRLGKGEARKSMVLASDIGQLINRWNGEDGVFNLTDGFHPSLSELDTYMAKKSNKKVRSVSPEFLTIISKVGDFIPGFPLNSYRLRKLSDSLTFSDSKARQELNWKPKSVIGNF